MGIYNSEGIVLHKIPFSNTSLIVSYLTKSFGKIKLVCRGVRGSKKQPGVHFEPGSLVELEWYKKDNSDDLAESKNEPILQDDKITEESENLPSSNEEEFSAEDSDIEEEFNQESEEELLDIPTFLRRQAN